MQYVGSAIKQSAIKRGRPVETKTETQKELGFREIIPVRKEEKKGAAPKQEEEAGSGGGGQTCDFGQVTSPP